FCRFSPDHRTMAHHVHDVTLEPENYTTPWDVTNSRSAPVSRPSSAVTPGTMHQAARPCLQPMSRSLHRISEVRSNAVNDKSKRRLQAAT
ncbi:hypothetical protein PYV02_14055, partial [Leifsonia sp. H3M29-4]|uniref:hypothetical protein n=1 Tax=Salinibacterium metalliresistens TaxID=3031321 RepID=UPI0023DA15B7